MRVCTRCLHRNDDAAAFCASCGTFLEWSSEKVASDGVDGSASPPRPARRRTAQKRAATSVKRPAQRAPAVSPDADEAPAAPGPGPGPDDDLAIAVENLRRRVEANRRQRAGLPPLEQPPPTRVRARPKAPAVPAPAEVPPPVEPGSDEAEATAQDGPGPEQPRKAHPFDDDRRPRDAPVQDDMVAHAGDVVCTRCQAGNAPSRYFCRRCGSPLQAEEVIPAAAATPTTLRHRWWWHRLLSRRKEADEIAPTVAAPPSRRERAWAALPVVLLLGLVAAVLGPCRPAVTERLEDARKRISPRYEHVYPAGVHATSAVDGHPPEAVVDRAPNTYWSEAGPTAGEGEELTFRFDRPVDLGRIGFYNGAQAKPQDFLTQPRLRELHLFFDSGSAAALTLKDRDAFQNHAIDAKGVTRVSLRIVSVYPSPQGGTEASLGEVEFFTRT